MSERKPEEKPEDFEFNALNNVSRPKNRGRKYDPYTSNFRNLTRRLQQDHFTEDCIEGMYQFRAIVLRVETGAQFSVTDPDSWGSLDLFGDEAPKLQVLKIRIPEIHAAMPIPGAYGDAPDDSGSPDGAHQGQINNYYPTVVAASEDLPTVKAGDVINVAFGSLENLTDGIYLSKVKAGEAGTTDNSTTGGGKAFANNPKGGRATDLGVASNEITPETHWNFHSSEPLPEDWDIKNFTANDLKSKGNGRVVMNKKALRALDKAASRHQEWGHPPIRLTNMVRASRNGGYRDPAFNAKSGGSETSRHQFGDGFDIWTSGWTEQQRIQILANLYNVGFRGFGHGKANIHADTWKKRRWAYGGYPMPAWSSFDGRRQNKKTAPA